jgi:hypothetical protein
MVEKEILKATVTIESYPKILEELFLMLAKKTLHEGTNPSELGIIIPALMEHLAKICASFTPMMNQENKEQYKAMLVKSFTEGIDLEFDKCEKIKEIFAIIAKKGGV